MTLGFMKGFVKSFSGLMGWGLAFLFTVFVLPYTYPFVTDYMGESLWVFIVTACIFFFIFLVLLAVISDWLARIVRGGHLRKVDNVLGVAYGVLKSILLCGVLYWGLLVLAPEAQNNEWIQGAYVLPLIEKTATFFRENTHIFLDDTFEAVIFFKEHLGLSPAALKEFDLADLKGTHILESISQRGSTSSKFFHQA